MDDNEYHRHGGPYRLQEEDGSWRIWSQRVHGVSGASSLDHELGVAILLMLLSFLPSAVAGMVLVLYVRVYRMGSRR